MPPPTFADGLLSAATTTAETIKEDFTVQQPAVALLTCCYLSNI